MWQRWGSLPACSRLAGGSGRCHIRGMPLQFPCQLHARRRRGARLGLAAAGGRCIRRGSVWAIPGPHHLGQVALQGLLLQAVLFDRCCRVGWHLCGHTAPLLSCVFPQVSHTPATCIILSRSKVNNCGRLWTHVKATLKCEDISRRYKHLLTDTRLISSTETSEENLLAPTCRADIP